MLFTHIILCKEIKWERNLAGISSIENTLVHHGNKPIKPLCQQIDRKQPLVK